MNRSLLLVAASSLIGGEDFWGPVKNKNDVLPPEPIHLRSQNPVIHCDDCMWLSPKEKQQSSKKEPHICTKFKVQVYHHNQHPKIFRCVECLNKPVIEDQK